MQIKSFISRLVLTYFRFLAKLQLKKNQPTVIGITGTAGKTSTLFACYAVLQEFEQVKASFKANSESGIPLNILGLQNQNYSALEWLWLIIVAPLALITNWESYDTYLAEMAIDSPDPPKNMGYLLTIIQPEVGVFLNVKPMHSLEFDKLVTETNPQQRAKAITQAIAQEKGKLITSLPKKGTAVLNTDDQAVIAFKNQTVATTVTFGQAESATIRLSQTSQSLNGTSFSYQYNHITYQLQFPQYILPKHFGYSFAAALAVAISQGVQFKQALKALENNFKLPKGRSSLIPAINDAYIIDSSYNASAEPTIDALELLNTIAKNKKLALLGDIRELGQESRLEHQRVAQKAAQICDEVVLVGPKMKSYALPVVKQAGTPVQWFANAAQAARYLKTILAANDVLLVKGSQNTLLLEIAVEKLMKNPDQANQLLCRRGRYWDARRQALLD